MLFLIFYALAALIKKLWHADRVVFLTLGVSWVFVGTVWMLRTPFDYLWIFLGFALLLAAVFNQQLGVESAIVSTIRHLRLRRRLFAAGVARPVGMEAATAPAEATTPAVLITPADSPLAPGPKADGPSPPPPAHPPAAPKPALSDGIIVLGTFLDIEALSDRAGTDLAAVEALETTLRGKLRGQEVGITVMVDALSRVAARASLDPHRPLSVMMIGPTGVGKTETVKLTASALGRRLLRFDMGAYKDQAALWTFLGSHQGYVGGEGKLTSAVASTPDAVILFDEIEKAYPDIYDAFLPLLDEGFLKDTRSDQTVDFSRTIICMTSNLVAQIPDEMYEHPEQARDLVVEKQYFRKEFVGRIQFVVPFRALTPPDIRTIAFDQLMGFVKRMKVERHLTDVQLDRGVADFLVSKADLKFGARDLKHLITRYVNTPLSKSIVARRGAAFTILSITMRSGTPAVEIE